MKLFCAWRRRWSPLNRILVWKSRASFQVTCLNWQRETTRLNQSCRRALPLSVWIYIPSVVSLASSCSWWSISLRLKLQKQYLRTVDLPLDELLVLCVLCHQRKVNSPKSQLDISFVSSLQNRCGRTRNTIVYGVSMEFAIKSPHNPVY